MRRTTGMPLAGAVIVLLAWTGSAMAHHAMGGETPQTWIQGILSGLAHPLIGPDHLAFIVAIGIIAAITGHGLGLIATFLLATMVGVGAHAAGIDVPMGEALVALSLLAAGVLIWSPRQRAGLLWAQLAVAAGLVHGYAYGGSIVGAERAPLLAYLLGLALIQGLIAASALAVAERFSATPGFREAWLPRAGLVVALMGAALLVLQVPAA